jgi:hypothetical protein
MMKIKTSETTPIQINWLVASIVDKHVTLKDIHWGNYAPSTDWDLGGRIIEREKIATSPLPNNSWRAYAPMGTRVLNGREIFSWEYKGTGPTPLIAAMRCYVASKLGDEVEVPDELA